jgi:hypothetical protein
MLIVPSFIGLCISLMQAFLDSATYNSLYQRLMPVFGIMIIIWGTTFISMWRRRQSELALWWGMQELELEDHQNPNYNPNGATGSKRLMIYAAVFVIFGIQACLLMLATFFLYAITVYLFFAFPNCNDINKEDCNMRFWAIDVGTTLLYVVFIALADYTAVGLLARNLTAMENHETMEQHTRLLAHKIFSFYFLDGFLWYIFMAFVQIPLTGSATMNNFLEKYMGLNMQELNVSNPAAFAELNSQTFWMVSLSTFPHNRKNLKPTILNIRFGCF